MTSNDLSEVRCASCGRITPLAPYCTHCGAVVHEGVGGARPHALDREELERRIRERRPESPFRRGENEPDDEGLRSYRDPPRFAPEPADQLARSEAEEAEKPPRVDYFDERAARRASADQAWGSPVDRPSVPSGTGGIPGAALPAGMVDWPPKDLADAGEGSEAVGAAEAGGGSAAAYEGRGEDAYQADTYQADTYQAGAPDYGDGDGGVDGPAWTGYGEPPRRGSGSLAIVGFLVLGIAALLGGAFLFAALNAPSPVSQVTQSASATASPTASEGAATPTASEGASPGSASTQPTAVPSRDNFSANVQPCASSKMGFSGCVDDGTRLSGDQVWVWVGFKNGQASTVLGVTIVNQATKSAVGDGSLELDQLIGCDPGKSCSGYMQMSFGNLDAGSYEIRVTRDGDQVAKTSFTVSA